MSEEPKTVVEEKKDNAEAALAADEPPPPPPPPKNKLTPELISQNLAQLGKTFDGSSYAYTRLVVEVYQFFAHLQ